MSAQSVFPTLEASTHIVSNVSIFSRKNTHPVHSAHTFRIAAHVLHHVVLEMFGEKGRPFLGLCIQKGCLGESQLLFLTCCTELAARPLGDRSFRVLQCEFSKVQHLLATEPSKVNRISYHKVQSAARFHAMEKLFTSFGGRAFSSDCSSSTSAS